MPGRAQEGRNSGSTSPPPPSLVASPTSADNRQPRAEPPEDCCVCHETLVAPMVHLRSCPHRLHLPCYAALGVRAATALRCPACRATVTVGKADKRALRQHSEAVMAEAMAVARRDMPPSERGRSSTRITRDGARRRVICSICHGVVEETALVRMSCSCEVHRRCALGFVEDVLPRARVNGVRTITYQVTCPNPSLHEGPQEVNLHPLLQQIRVSSGSADTAEERTIDARITAAELHLNRRSTTPTGTIDFSRSPTERGEADIRGDWRGTAPRQAQVEAPCGACGQQVTDRDRLVFESWLAHIECAVKNVQGASDRGDDMFRVAIRGGDGPPRRRAFRLTDILPILYQRYDGSTEWGVRRRRQLERSWRSAISEAGEAPNLAQNQQTGRRLGDETQTACTYCGLALEESTAGSGGIQLRVPGPCPHGGFVHPSCMLERVDRLATAYTDPRSCVACRSEWMGGRRPPQPAELASGLPTKGSEERWAALRGTMQFTELLQRDAPGPGPDSYRKNGVYSSFELMVRAHGRSSTSLFLLCSLFSDALGLPQTAYLDFPRSREWEVAVGRYRALFKAFGIRSQDILLRLTNRRLYIGPHVQGSLAGLDAEWEERLTRWTLGVQNALEEGIVPPPFPVDAAPSPRRTEPALESDPRLRGQPDQERETPRTTDNRQDDDSRDSTSGGQPGMPPTKSEAASTPPGATGPSNRGERGAIARGSRGRSRGSGRASRAASAESGAYTSTGQNPRHGGSAPPSSAGRGARSSSSNTNGASAGAAVGYCCVVPG